MRRYELSNEEWAIIAPLLPNNSRGIERVDDRRVINGICGVSGLVRPGEMCRSVMARARRFTIAFLAGTRRALGLSSGRCFKALRWRHRDDRQFLCSRSPAWCQR